MYFRFSRQFFCFYIFILCSILMTKVSGRAKRCYVCRSRGPLGDCKDPFDFNSTTIESSGAEVQFCASGWCGKSREGENEGQHLVATERMCLQRPPSDNKERCAETFYGNKKKTFFMCFCKGDLCNNALKSIPSQFCMLSLVLFIVILLY